MKRIITLCLLLIGSTAFAQLGSVSPQSNTQGSMTAGANVTTSKAVVAPSHSMQDINRFHGPYSNGNVDAQSDQIHILFTDSYPAELDFTGTVVSSSPLVLELDGYDNISQKPLQLQVTIAPDNKKNPKELYNIKEMGNPNVWVLTEDPFNPKE